MLGGTPTEGSRALLGRRTLDELLDNERSRALDEDVLNLPTPTNLDPETILADSADCDIRLTAPHNHGTIVDHSPNLRKAHNRLEDPDCLRNGLAPTGALTFCSQRSAHVSSSKTTYAKPNHNQFMANSQIWINS